MMNMGQIRARLKRKKLRVMIELTEGHYVRMPLNRGLFLRLTINAADDQQVNAHIGTDCIVIEQIPKGIERREKVLSADSSISFFDVGNLSPQYLRVNIENRK